MIFFESKRSKLARANSLSKYIHETKYFKEMANNDKLFVEYYSKEYTSENDIKKDIEIWVKTIGIESLSGKFKVSNLMRFLYHLSNDIFNEGGNRKVSEIVKWFQENIMLFFLNETKAEKFNQEYFIDDCFRFICDQLALKNKIEKP